MNNKHSKTEIYSIFGQIDGVVAQMMVDEGKATKIAQEMIPPTVLYDETGMQKAKFAIALPRAYLGEYERRVRDLYA
jgi:hypothetical protein